MTNIYIDADACPVKDETIRVAERHDVKVFIVSNGGLRPNLHPLVENIIVPDGPDIADMWIADRARKGDLVITGDIPLAAKLWPLVHGLFAIMVICLHRLILVISLQQEILWLIYVVLIHFYKDLVNHFQKQIDLIF